MPNYRKNIHRCVFCMDTFKCPLCLSEVRDCRMRLVSRLESWLSGTGGQLMYGVEEGNGIGKTMFCSGATGYCPFMNREFLKVLSIYKLAQVNQAK